MLKKTNRFVLSLAIAAPMFLVPQAYAEQEPLTTIITTEAANSQTAMLDETVSPMMSAATVTVTPININTASQAELTALSGIGKNKALRIVQWRELNGAFESTAQLAQVNGIGTATVTKLSEFITVTN